MMNHFPKQARSLALALGFAASLGAVSAVSVFAEDPGVRCAAKVGPGQYEFYLPGERATDVNGKKWVCGPDGQWFRDYSSAIISNPFTRPVAVYTTLISAPAVAVNL